MTPRDRIRKLAGEIGEVEVARWCAGLLAGSIRHDDPSHPSLEWVGGPHAESLLRDHAAALGVNEHWPRVWGARGLLYAWAPEAESAVRGGLSDGAWRVREMSAKVVKVREVTDAEALLATLLNDDVARVRAAGVLALGRVGEVEHVAVIERRLDDEDESVRRAARTALAALSHRLEYDAARIRARG